MNMTSATSPPMPKNIPAPRRPAQAKANLRRRERILEAAGRCFAERGVKGATMDEIAVAADVSKPFIYKHFEGKDLLVEAVLAEALATWEERTGEAISCGGTVCERLAGRIRAAVAFAHERPVLGAILRRDHRLLRSGYTERFREAREASLETTRGLLHEGIQSKELRQDLDVEGTTRAIELLHFSVVEASLDGHAITASAGLLDAAIDLICRGIVAG